MIKLIKFVNEQKQTIKQKDPSIKNSAEVFLHPGFWAIAAHKVSHKLYRRKRFFFARLVSMAARFVTGIEIHPGAKIGRRLFIDHGLGVVIGETTVIGCDVLIYQGVTLGGTGKDVGKRHPTIGNNVMIGAGVKVLGPVKISTGVRIGAGSVVLVDIPPHCTAVGVPAKIVRRNGEKKPVDCLDQTQFPNIYANELNELKERVDNIESKIKE